MKNSNKDVQKSFHSNWKKTAQARDPSIPKDWPSGPAGKKPPTTWKQPEDRKDGKYFPYRKA